MENEQSDTRLDRCSGNVFVISGGLFLIKPAGKAAGSGSQAQFVSG